MLPVWNDEIATGYAPLDDDHRDVITVMETFLRAVESGARTELLPSFDAFIVRVERHFAAEEALMGQLTDPSAGDHREAHASFLTHLRRTRDEQASRGVSEQLRQWAFGRCVTWFRFHIKAYDFGLARRAAERGVAYSANPPS